MKDQTVNTFENKQHTTKNTRIRTTSNNDKSDIIMWNVPKYRILTTNDII